MDIEIGVPGQIMPPADRAIENVKRNEAAGFDSVWWPSHLMGWHPQSVWTEDLTPLANVQDNPHVYFDPLVMMGAAGSHTERIKVGVVVTDLITRHPAVAAQMALTVDHLAQGRSILGLGSGEAMNVSPYGMTFDRPVGRLAEGIEVMRKLWTTDGPVDYVGKTIQLKSAVIGLSPYQGRTPPIWVAAHGPKMLALTGRLADGWLPTKTAPAVYARSLDDIRKAAVDAGRDPDNFTPGMLGYVLLAPDEAALAHLTRQPLVRFLCVMLPPDIYRSMGLEPPMGGSGFHELVPAAVDRPEAMRIIDAIPPEVVRYYAFCGTPEQVAEQVIEYHGAGLRHLICWNITPFGDPELAGWSFKALGQLKEMLKSA
jgi:phthiodiolone/phenolphthiodiolone dimycocerosates ketoreductase